MSVESGELMRVFSGNANEPLAEEIAYELGTSLGAVEIGRFSNGEIQVIINESVRGTDVFIIQPTCGPVNDSVMELLIMIDAFRRASADRITAVIPFYGYARQDRKTRGREPISAKLVANLLLAAKVDRILTVDLHAGQIQGFFDIPVDHLTAVPILGEYFRDKGLEDVVAVSPDSGGVTRARKLAAALDVSMAVIDKRRPAPNEAEVRNIIGDVKGKVAIIVDDMIDTGGSIVAGGQALMEHGAQEVYACCTHAVLSGPAVERLQFSTIKEIVVTNTIPLTEDQRSDKIKVLSAAPLLGKAIQRIHSNRSVSALFG